ncbi:hypothetical protein F5880DRAFT_118894 [Lentinula raphanica]|nr:hypothetical protein F5880DRAFT_118894 [Lentinula raphanica]
MRLFHPIYVVGSVLVITYAMPMDPRLHALLAPPVQEEGREEFAREILLRFSPAESGPPHDEFPPESTAAKCDYLRARGSISILLPIRNREDALTGKEHIMFPYKNLNAPANFEWRFKDSNHWNDGGVLKPSSAPLPHDHDVHVSCCHFSSLSRHLLEKERGSCSRFMG